MTATIAWVGSDQQKHVRTIKDNGEATRVIEQFEQDAPEIVLKIEWIDSKHAPS